MTRIPYGVNKAKLVERIAGVAREEKLKGLPSLVMNQAKVCGLS